MRLAIISSRFPCGNHEPYLSAELAALRPGLERLVVAPLRPNGHRTQDTGGAEVVLLPPWAPATILLAAKTFLRAPRAAMEALFEILRAPGSPFVTAKNLVVYPRALALAQRLRSERIDHVHAYWLSTPATAAFIVARVSGIAWSATAHCWDIFEQNMIAQKADSASFVRVISERGRSELVRRAPQVAQKFVVVRLGTALKRNGAIVRERPDGARGHRLELLCAAAFVFKKGHTDLLDAFARAYAADPSLRLTLCGSGPLEAQIRERAAALPCGAAIRFRGYVEHSRLLRELAQGLYGAIVLASRDDGVREMEGVPSILIEASSLGIPCITTRSGGIEELLDERSAFLAEVQNSQSLAEAILAATDADERRRRAERAYERSHQMHDPARSADDLIALLGAQL